MPDALTHASADRAIGADYSNEIVLFVGVYTNRTRNPQHSS